MPIATPADPRAAAAAEAEARVWAELAATWQADRHPDVWEDRPPREVAVVGHHDPAEDLARRAGEWGHALPSPDLGDLAAFAAGLARAEAEAWRDAAPDVAVRAFETRQFLLGDRIIHWAVPWLDGVGGCHLATRGVAHHHRDLLLAVGEEHRPAPRLTGREGVHPPGEDAFGPTQLPVTSPEVLDSLWSGVVLLRSTIVSLLGRIHGRRLDVGEVAAHVGDLALLYGIAAARWRRLALDHPGTAALWEDLAGRACRTAAELEEFRVGG